MDFRLDSLTPFYRFWAAYQQLYHKAEGRTLLSSQQRGQVSQRLRALQARPDADPFRELLERLAVFATAPVDLGPAFPSSDSPAAAGSPAMPRAASGAAGGGGGGRADPLSHTALLAHIRERCVSSSPWLSKVVGGASGGLAVPAAGLPLAASPLDARAAPQSSLATSVHQPPADQSAFLPLSADLAQQCPTLLPPPLPLEDPALEVSLATICRLLLAQ